VLCNQLRQLLAPWVESGKVPDFSKDLSTCRVDNNDQSGHPPAGQFFIFLSKTLIINGKIKYPETCPWNCPQSTGIIPSRHPAPAGQAQPWIGVVPVFGLPLK
jgi:hypothetical protein